MDKIATIFTKFMTTIFAAILFILLKRLADRRRPSLEDANDVAWAMILISFGLMAGYSKSWTAAYFAARIVWNSLFGLILLLNLRRNVKVRARFITNGIPAPSIAIIEACGEMLIGMAAVFSTIRS